MNESRPNGAPGAGAPARAAGLDCPTARVRRRWLAQAGAVIAAGLGVGLLAAWLGGHLDGLGLALAPIIATAAFGAAWLAFERGVAPELRALERARAELDERHVAALRARGETSEYLRDVSQEIRATMHAVLGQTQLLSRSPLDATQHRQMRTIDGAARVLLRIINDLMALSGSGRRGFDVVPMGGSLHDVLRVSADLLETAAKNRGLELQLRVALDLPDRVLIDTGRVQQLLLGACRLAVEASTQGTLRIDARPLDMTDGRFVLLLHVEPESAPAPQSEAGRGPAPGAARRAPGSSLLLELVGAMGGSLVLGETPGMLELRLPVQRIDGGAPRRRPPPEAVGQTVIRLPVASAPLLVVDSDEPSRLAAIELLENLGFEVEVASAAPRALERVAQAKFSLILLDTELVGVDGYVAAARILTQLGRERPPIIGLCREPLAASRDRAAAAGMDALLAKPIEREALCAALAEWLPEENNPASSGLRLSQAGALAQATERGQAAKRSPLPLEALPDLAPEVLAARSASSIERFVREAPGQYRLLASAVARGQHDEAASLAAALAERCASCGAVKMAALCRILEGGRALSGEALGQAVDALGRTLDAVLRQLRDPLEPSESPPASVTHDRTPDGP